MMFAYALRVTLTNCTASDVRGYLVAVSPKVWYMSEEDGKDDDNPHVHAFFLSDSKVSALRMRIRRIAGKGNGIFSMKELALENNMPSWVESGDIGAVPDISENLTYDAVMGDDGGILENYPYKYLAYISKQGNVQHRGFTTCELAWVDLYDHIVKLQIKAKKAKRVTQLQELCALVDAMKVEHPNIPIRASDIPALVVDFYKDRGILVRQFQLVSLCQTIMLKYIPTYRINMVDVLTKTLNISDR